MKISYAITVCNEYVEIQKLVNFLREKKRQQDEIVVLFDQKNGSEEVSDWLIKQNKYPNVQFWRGYFEGHFADWKNELTKHCSGDYIFQIDADEIPNEKFINILPDIINSNTADIMLVPRINTVEGLTDEYISKWNWRVDDNNRVNFPDYQWRLYRNTKDIKWVNKVHEVLEGYKTFIKLPPAEDYALYHPKTLAKQIKQNNYYENMDNNIELKSEAKVLENEPVYKDLMDSSKYKFSEKWFDHNRPLWDKLFNEYKIPIKNVLEIGCFEGRATIYLCLNVLKEGTNYHVVDTFGGSGDEDGMKKTLARLHFNPDAIYEKFKHNIDQHPEINFKVTRKISQFALPEIQAEGNMYDLIYVDASHKADDTFVDAYWAHKMLNEGGILIFDDFGWKNKDVEDILINSPAAGIKTFVAMYEHLYKIIHTGYQVILQKGKQPTTRI